MEKPGFAKGELFEIGELDSWVENKLSGASSFTEITEVNSDGTIGGKSYLAVIKNSASTPEDIMLLCSKLEYLKPSLKFSFTQDRARGAFTMEAKMTQE